MRVAVETLASSREPQWQVYPEHRVKSTLELRFVRDGSFCLQLLN
jgi:hypothetical protein